MKKSLKGLLVVFMFLQVMFGISGVAFADGGDTTPPEQFRLVEGSTSTDTTATFSWNAATDDVGVVAYDVYLSDGQGIPEVVTFLGSVPSTQTSYTITGLLPGTAYGGYYVNARDAAGNVTRASGDTEFAGPYRFVKTTGEETKIWAGTYGVNPARPDNTSYLQGAVDMAILYDKPLVLPAGVINVSGNVDVKLHAVETFEIEGQGTGNTTLKRTDGSITADNQHMFSFKMPYSSEYIDAPSNNISVSLHDFTIDGNKRGNPFPVDNTNPKIWEHSADVNLLGFSEDVRISNIAIYNMTLNDPVADHFKFGGTSNSGVGSVTVNDVVSTNFSNENTRADFYASAGIDYIAFDDSILHAVEANFGAEYFQHNANGNFLVESKWVFNGTTVDDLDIKGYDRTSVDEDGYPERSLWLSTDGATIGKLHLAAVHSEMINGTVSLADEVTNRIDSVDADFSGVTFKHKLNASGNITPLTFYANNKNRVSFRNNSFVVDSADQTINPDGFSLWFKPTGSPSYQMKYYLMNNTFDSRLKKNIDIDRADYVELSGNQFSGSDYAIRLYSASTRPLTVVDNGGNTWPITKYNVTSSNGLTYTP